MAYCQPVNKSIPETDLDLYPYATHPAPTHPTLPFLGFKLQMFEVRKKEEKNVCRRLMLLLDMELI